MEIQLISPSCELGKCSQWIIGVLTLRKIQAGRAGGCVTVYVKSNFITCSRFYDDTVLHIMRNATYTLCTLYHTSRFR